MKTLHIMFGLPRSGKSTIAKELGFPIVNPDSIRLALHNQRFIAEAESMVWAIAEYMVKALFIAGHDDVVLDATNTTKKKRDKWISDGWQRKFHVIHTPEETCIERAIETNDNEIIPVIIRMSKQFEPLGFDGETDFYYQDYYKL